MHEVVLPLDSHPSTVNYIARKLKSDLEKDAGKSILEPDVTLQKREARQEMSLRSDF